MLAATGAAGTATPAAAPGTGYRPGLRYYYPVPRDPGGVRTDVCVYGGTSAGVVAAVRAAQAGRSVALVVFGRHLGGLSSAGLGATDTGRIEAIGGLSREFYRRLGEHYGRPESFTFEPHVAESIFDAWVAEAGVQVFLEHRLESVRVTDRKITALRTENGKLFVADAFIDATYEGDLLAAAGVTYAVGRESNATYGETLNGVQFRTGHQFQRQIDPYVVPGDPASGLLQGISADPPGTTGEGDRRIQAYNFRICLTRSAERRPFPRPPGYDPARYELLLRYLRAGVWDAMRLNTPMPNGKTDMNNNGAVSTDNIGRNYEWPEADYATRETIFQDHVTYQQGMLWFLANDPRVPENVRAEVNGWGLTQDEFTGTDGWSHELYIREGRRMVSDYVITEHDCRWNRAAPDPVALASYTMDSHDCARVVVNGFARNEGDVQVPPAGPYGISYRSIVPARGECENLLVACAISASHIAFGSARMEPVFMATGQAAAVAAELALDGGTSVQDVDYPTLRRRLRAEQMVLTWPPGASAVTVEAPEQLAPGTSGNVTVTVVNEEATTATGLRLALGGPDGWTLAPTTPDEVDALPPGESFQATWRATAGIPDRAVQDARLTATATYRLDGQADPVTDSTEHTVVVAEPVQPPLLTTASTRAYFGQRGSELAVLGNGADLWTGIDQYGAVYLPDGAGPTTTATVTVVEQEATDPNARAGLVFRNDLTAAGVSTGYVALVVKPANGLLVLWDADGSGTVESVLRAQLNPSPSPVHLRLTREETRFHASYSLDGSQWQVIGTVTLPTAAATQDVGVLSCAHVETGLGRAVFEDLTVTP
ncbi:FAD-dependent oxidoreductase [Jiangella asiatica]|uniref:FAD-dependent oxidoreductase n=1 Tax=Jiangella asiatica TaxID=2530372 RepID=UPI00193CD38F|nr:FAD-dependent oxidoreductase [Jiangella asiatica]